MRKGWLFFALALVCALGLCAAFFLPRYLRTGSLRLMARG